MGFKVTLQPSGHTFEVPDGTTVLNAGLDAGFAMPYSCRAATCRTCRARVAEGKVDYGRAHAAYLSDEEKAKGYALMCAAKPLSDLVVEVHELTLDMIRPRIVPCRIKQIRKPAPDVAILNLRTPMNDNMMFAAGQYVDFILKDRKRRSYSIANPPLAEGVMNIELHVRHTPGGLFTDHVFSTMKENDLLRFEGPLGTFYLREESTKPIVFVASGTGFAPIKAMIEHAIRKKIARPMTLYWGCRSLVDLYMQAVPQAWQAEVADFRYVPVLSEARPQDRWTGRTGFVHRAVMEDFPDLSGCQVYACGAPVMVDAARRDFIEQCRLPEEEFFADSFLTEAELAAAAAP
jgi:CDP-4-dehydro-6-deoxyglucose reductase